MNKGSFKLSTPNPKPYYLLVLGTHIHIAQEPHVDVHTCWTREKRNSIGSQNICEEKRRIIDVGPAQSLLDLIISLIN